MQSAYQIMMKRNLEMTEEHSFLKNYLISQNLPISTLKAPVEEDDFQRKR